MTIIGQAKVWPRRTADLIDRAGSSEIETFGQSIGSAATTFAIVRELPKEHF